MSMMVPSSLELSRSEHGGFNPLPQKIPMRYSFSLSQKRVLMKHYENGMFGQSLAYQDKIVACAHEAGVDFDIVRNWIGNMRRKRRMEDAQQSNMPISQQASPLVENKRRFSHQQTPPFSRSQFVFVQHPSQSGSGGPRPNIGGPRPNIGGPHPNVGGPRPNVGGPCINVGGPHPSIGGPGPNISGPHPNVGGPHPVLPVGSILQQNPPNPSVPSATMQNVSPSNLTPQHTTPQQASPRQSTPLGGTDGSPQVAFRTGVPTKQETDGDTSCCLVSAVSTPTPGHAQSTTKAAETAAADRHDKLWASAFPEETLPMMKGSVAVDINEEWRQQQIQAIMNQMQQSVYQLENLGCECLVATVAPAEGGTYITGTTSAVQYFSEMQKIQAMSDYVSMFDSPLSPANSEENEQPGEAGEEAGNQAGNQTGQQTSRTGMDGDQTSYGEVEDGPSKGKEVDKDEGSSGEEVDQSTNDGEVIKAGEEVYIVNKKHFIIGTGTLLPAPHQRIELKNTALS